ncbi:Transposon Tf2-8 polyprotein [Vitis vinifera]|uniref:Transposon Tf2-8 polyprotein n=1 Tax=Vitis vinifera TaxID=29760 RepID=A0A438BZ46_VITVI|nr:Transposon Tf2-8 polyprotein [Vitis vinifera]
MLAIVEAIRLWRPYLLGRKFYIKTDQRSLKFFLDQRVATPEQQKWVAKLLGYDYEIIFRPGHENSAADALSRRQESPLLAALHFSEVDIWKQIREASKSDSYVQLLGKKVGDPPHGNLTWRDGLLLYKGKVVVPADHSLRAKLLYEVHDSKVGGHSGILRTYRKLQKQFYWPKMHKAVQEYVWEDITLDFIEGLPTSHGKDTILVVVDRLSKFAHFIPLTHPFTAKVVAENFIEELSNSMECHVPSSMIATQSSSANSDKNSSNSPAPNSCSVQLTIHKQTAKLMLLIAVLNNICAASFTNGCENGVLISLGQSIARIHPVFHVSLLKPYNGTPAVTPLDLPPLADNGVITLEPQQILDTRWIKRGDTFMEESLVHWKHLPHEEATWESTDTLCHQFPHLMLEDKHPLHGVGNNKPKRSCRTSRPNSRYMD